MAAFCRPRDSAKFLESVLQAIAQLHRSKKHPAGFSHWLTLHTIDSSKGEIPPNIPIQTTTSKELGLNSISVSELLISVIELRMPPTGFLASKSIGRERSNPTTDWALL
jgi:hypothetical protein